MIRGIVSPRYFLAHAMAESDHEQITRDRGRIDELEARLAEQDQSILELSDEIFRQQQHIGQLETQLRHLAERVKSLATAAAAPDPADEVPPHY